MMSDFLINKEEAKEYPVPQINGTEEQQTAVTELHHQFNVTTEDARTIVKQFMEEMQKGLDQDGATGKKNRQDPLDRSKLIYNSL